MSFEVDRQGLGLARLASSLDRVMKRRSDLLGLDEPKRISVENLSTDPLEDQRRKLHEDIARLEAGETIDS